MIGALKNEAVHAGLQPRPPMTRARFSKSKQSGRRNTTRPSMTKRSCRNCESASNRLSGRPLLSGGET